MQILEVLFIIFRITPYSRSIARSLLKEPKVFFFDSGLVIGNAQRLENTAAVCLLKHCSAIEDLDGTPCRLQYLRTKDGKEADFCIVRNGGVEQAIEVKTGEKDLDRGLKYFCGKYDLPGVQLVANLRMERKLGTIAVRRAEEWLGGLRM